MLRGICAAIALSAAASHLSPYSGLGRVDPHVPLHPLPYLINRRSPPPPAPRAAPYCVPSAPCWPSPAEWAAFNTSLGGALVFVTPPLAPCFGFDGAPPDGPACNAVLNNFTDSYARAALPGAMQNINWEKDWATGASCFEADQPCVLGNIPPFAVAAATPTLISAAIAFAAARNIRVVIKSTGHEYQGRSTAPDALLIWTHVLRGVSFTRSFSACAGAPVQPAVTTTPGTSWGEVYKLADANSVEVVGGSEISVSSCGGYTMGGGHSWMGPAHGMAVDNLLRVEAVLADGSAVTASACEHTELFWALRGGGGGSFAVATSCTYAAHPFAPAGAAGLFATVKLLQGETSLAVFLDGLFAYAHTLSSVADSASGVVAGGYFLPNLGAGTIELLLAFNGTVAQASAALVPLQSWVATVPQFVVIDNASTSLVAFDSLMAFHESFDSHSEPTGDIETLGSRLIPAAVMRDDAARATVAINLTTIAYTVGGFTGLFVAGGAVAAADPDSAATSITPAWRAAGAHVVFGAGWAVNATSATQQAITEGVSGLNDLLRAATPGSGSYWSESDVLEPAWEDSFWGSNYARLQAVKAKYDPRSIFGCHHCVELPSA